MIFGLIILIHRTIEKSKKLILELDASLDIIDKHIIYSKTDDKGIITETSLAFEQLSGYEKNELVGQSHNVIRHSDNSQEFFKVSIILMNVFNQIQLEHRLLLNFA